MRVFGWEYIVLSLKFSAVHLLLLMFVCDEIRSAKKINSVYIVLYILVIRLSQGKRTLWSIWCVRWTAKKVVVLRDRGQMVLVLNKIQVFLQFVLYEEIFFPSFTRNTWRIVLSMRALFFLLNLLVFERHFLVSH